jgi:hypothetical protein
MSGISLKAGRGPTEVPLALARALAPSRTHGGALTATQWHCQCQTVPVAHRALSGDWQCDANCNISLSRWPCSSRSLALARWQPAWLCGVKRLGPQPASECQVLRGAGGHLPGTRGAGPGRASASARPPPARRGRQTKAQHCPRQCPASGYSSGLGVRVRVRARRGAAGFQVSVGISDGQPDKVPATRITGKRVRVAHHAQCCEWAKPADI